MINRNRRYKLGCLLCFCIGGISEIRISPDGGLCMPSDGFKPQNVTGEIELQTGLNLDYVWRNFGLELPAGILKNATANMADLPPIGGFITPSSNRIAKDNKNPFLVRLGHICRLTSSRNFNLEILSKAGIFKYTYPGYTGSTQTGAQLNDGRLLYTHGNPEEKAKLNLAFRPTMKIRSNPFDKLHFIRGKYNIRNRHV